MYRTLAILLLSFCLTTPASAREVAGVDFPERIVRDDGELVLNGAGLRRKFFIKVYAAGLWLPQRMRDAGAVLAADPPWRVEMHILHSKISRKKINAAWEEGFEANQSPAAMAALRERLARFQSWFPDLKAGDRVVLDHVPGKGVALRINDQARGVIEGRDFARALLAVWLGREPADDDLREALLGR